MVNSATKVSSAGNIWTSSRASRPGRRPRNRSRENANAAIAPMRTDGDRGDPAMMSEFLYQLQ